MALSRIRNLQPLDPDLRASFTAVDVGYAMDLARTQAERLCGPLAKVPFLVTDNGSSFLARRFQQQTQGQFAHVRIRYRTPMQLGLLERFHETLKQEEVYWQLYQDPAQARESLATFREHYNPIRPHWALLPAGSGDVLTPADIYQRDEDRATQVAALGQGSQAKIRRTASASSAPVSSVKHKQ
jgi:transposase InsO family protein